jgi:predicted nucleotidyltransferase
MDSLFPRTRQAILSAVLLNPDRSWYVRDFARHLKIPVSNLAREVPRLVKAGFLKTWKDGSRVYIQADRENPIFPELRSLMVKTVGLVELLQDALAPMRKRIRLAFVFGSIANGEETSRSDVDLMVIGSAGLADLVPLLPPLTKTLLREINPVLYSPEEFKQRVKESRFVKSVLGRPLLFVIGTKDDLEGIIGAKTSRK